jgi:hypothetical protein
MQDVIAFFRHHSARRVTASWSAFDTLRFEVFSHSD